MNNLLGGNAAATINDLGTIAARQNAVLGSIGLSDPSAFSMAKIVAVDHLRRGGICRLCLWQERAEF